MPESPPRRRHVVEAVLLSVAFAVAHTQSPIGFSNQNQYLLHGLAAAGVGHLKEDWLANTADPTPVFSGLVAGLYSLAGNFGLQAAFFLLLMVYFLSIRSLIHALPGTPDTRSFRLAFAALFIAVHAALLRVASVAASGTDYPWYFQAGIAGQYVLGPGLQPSAFGVLLLTGFSLIVRGKPFIGIVIGWLSVVMHTTYLLPAGLLTLGVMLSLFLRRNPRMAKEVAVLSLIVAIPVIIHTLRTFGPTDEATFRDATRILAEVRIPHHCVISRWFDALAGLQIVWMCWGLSLLRRTKLFPILAFMAAAGLLLTLVQYFVESPAFALVFPWRVSVFLMPVATATILARLAALEKPGQAVNVISVTAVVLLAFGGVIVMAERRGYRGAEEEMELYDWVREHSKEGDVYLLPVRIPAVGGGRGALSTTFMPPPRPKPGSNLIPVDLQRFRLLTGTPIYVDFKAVPYKDVEVLEWHRRMKQCEDWYDGDWKKTGNSLKAEGVTHVVTPANKRFAAPFLELVHEGQAYRVYRVK